MTGTIALTANQKYSITMEFYENTATAVAKLYWETPGQTTFVQIPKAWLYAN